MNQKKESIPLIDCKLTGLGWFDFKVDFGTQSYRCNASYMEINAPDDLIQAVIDLHDGASHARLCMSQEPGSWRWILNKEGEQMRLRILLFRGYLFDNSQPDESGELVFDAHCSFMEFSVDYALSLKRLLEEWGVDGFKEKWRNEFPTEKYQILRRCVGI